jgi:hypothetical protein
MSDVDGKLRSDLVQLADLLSLLPDLDSRSGARAWWEQFAAVECQAHRPDESHPPKDRATYIAGKLADFGTVSTRIEALDLATNCLSFFDEPSEEMTDLTCAHLGFGNSGRRLLEAICQVAWRIFVPLELAAKRGQIDWG